VTPYLVRLTLEGYMEINNGGTKGPRSSKPTRKGTAKDALAILGGLGSS